jgi:hypothetical protein
VLPHEQIEHGVPGAVGEAGERARRMERVIRDSLGLPPGEAVTLDRLDQLVRQLNGAADGSEVEPEDRVRASVLIARLGEDGHRIGAEELSKAWREKHRQGSGSQDRSGRSSGSEVPKPTEPTEPGKSASGEPPSLAQTIADVLAGVR